MKQKLTILFLALAALAFGAIIYGGLTMVQITTPANPASGSNKLYFKSDNKLYSLTSAGTETEIGAGGGTAFNPTDTTVDWLRDDFGTGITTIGSPIGSSQIRTAQLGAGDVFSYAAVQGAGSGMELRSGTTAGNGVWIGATTTGSNGGTGRVNWYDLYNGEWEVVWVAKLSSTADVRFRAGLDQYKGIAGAPGSGSMWIRYDTNSAYDDDTKATGAGAFVAQICGYDDANCSGDTTGLTATLAGTVDTNWHKFRLYRAAGKINFQVDANASKTACLSGGGCDMTLPANPGYGLTTYTASPALIMGTDTTAAKSAFVDFFAWKITGLTR